MEPQHTNISQERIEAEVEAEAKRIEAWYNAPNRATNTTCLTPWSIRSLASHLVRNRLQIEMAQDSALLAAAETAWSYAKALNPSGAGQFYKEIAPGIEAAIKQAKEGAA